MNIRRKAMLASCVALCVALIACPLRAQTQRGPSTPEERAKAVKIAHELETDPLATDAKDKRAWIVRWIIEIPDISVPICTNILGPKFISEKPYGAELTGQIAISEVAYIIENPSKASDQLSVFMAGAQGVLRTYQAIQKQKSSVKRSSLDALLDLQAAGKLEGTVKQAMSTCTTHLDSR